MTCLPWETLVAYWAGDLPADEAGRVEEHLMECGVCAREAERVAAVSLALRTVIPPVISRAHLEALRARGLSIHEGTFAPGERRSVVFPRGLDLLVHRLGGLDLSRAERVDVVVKSESSGVVLFEELSAPFDRDAGEVLIACQTHFASHPWDVEFEVRATEPSGAMREARYLVPHVFER